MTTMTNDDRLWARVNAALDERRDPLSDPDVRAALERAPGRASDVQGLLTRLRHLRDPRPARVRGLAAAAAVLLTSAAVLALSSLRPEDGGRMPVQDVTLVVEHTSPPPARVARVVLEPERVLAWTLEGERP